ncbi:MAG: DinB family protein [Planctomycetota bacterium]
MPSSEPASASLGSATLDRLAWTRQFAEGLIRGVPQEHATARAAGKGNHTAWVAGHIAVTDDLLISAVTGEPGVLPESFQSMFGGGSEPLDDPAAYPTLEELLAAMTQARERVNAWVAGLSPNDYVTAMPDNMLPFAPDYGTLGFALAAHEMCHAGQVATCKAAIGLPRMFS